MEKREEQNNEEKRGERKEKKFFAEPWKGTLAIKKRPLFKYLPDISV